ncbi:MAG: drug/metabolite exporter YedA [Candidatus Promineifilaceae bacterium]|nr:drug/metabolite exporter YedA [Candidatus Promineifilaceae bacterium]
MPSPPRWKVVLAFAAVYLIWGSTYLAIRFAVETLPPFLLAGVRFLSAGAIMLAIARSRAAPWPTWRQWRSTLVVGALLLMGGNGGVTWAEQFVPSGLVALLIASVPVWMVLMDWLRPGGVRPSAQVFVGLALGLVGLVLLIGPGTVVGGGSIDPLGAAVVLLAAFSWAAGSIYSRGADSPPSPFMATAMQMLNGGALLIILGVVSGEVARFQPEAVSTRSVLSLLYLIFFGAIVGYTAYIWLLRVTTAARASTYAYVNPVVAVFLGWALADEPLTARILIAAAIIVGAVMIINTYRVRRRSPSAQEPSDEAARQPAVDPADGLSEAAD